MKLIEFGGIVEVAIPKKYYQFKTKHNLFVHLGIEVNKAIDKIKTIEKYSIYKTSFEHYSDSVKINDFNFCCYNKYKPSKTHEVYRFFGFDGLGVEEEIGKDFPDSFILNHKTKYGIIKINVRISCIGKYYKR